MAILVTILAYELIRTMINARIKLIATLGTALAASLGFSQSYSSFYQVDAIYGVHVTNSGLDYTVDLDPGAFLIYNGNQYDITDIFGFWNMKAGSALTASGTNQNGWNWDQSNSGGGSIAGWQNNPKTFDIQPGGSKTFTYTSLDQPSVEATGFHFSFVQDWAPTPGNKTAFVSGPLNPVPEPASMVALAAGAIALIRRRRR
jgi:hypothetical protein